MMFVFYNRETRNVQGTNSPQKKIVKQVSMRDLCPSRGNTLFVGARADDVAWGGPLWSPAVPRKNIGGEMSVQAERSDGQWGRDPIDRVPRVGWPTAAGRTPNSPPVSARMKTLNVP